MAEVPSAEQELGDEEEQAAEDGEEKAEKLNPQLLMACSKNHTETAVRLLEQQADPTCEDSRQWSPLIWAASWGDEALTRLLIQSGAAEVYKYGESHGKLQKKKHSPMHWAAFKGHLKVLWLLIGQKLSHHERDQLGNTALHQAAAGGCRDCTMCLMAQGADINAKNDRGHSPDVLCTVPEVKRELLKAMGVAACQATQKQFSSTVLRYLCSWSKSIFCESAVTQTFVYESPDAEKKEKPVTWCTEVRNMIAEAEQQLNHALQLNRLETITSALEAGEDKPVDVKLVFKCRQVKAKLETEIQLNKAMQVQVITELEEFQSIHENLSKAIEDAELKGADPARIVAAKTLRRKLMAEASLRRTVEGPQKTSPAHIMMLEELTDAARGENANEELLGNATRLVAKLKSEREVQQKIADTSQLCELKTFKDAAAKEGELPAWCMDTDEYENLHVEFKRVVEVAERDKIDAALMKSALAQLAQMENLLVEKKRMEEEVRLKASKKKGRK